MTISAAGMRTWIKTVLRHPIAQDLGKVFTATFFGRVGAFLASIYIIRSLPVAEYGLFAIGFQVMMLVPQVGDFGLRETLIRFGSDRRKEDPKGANTFIKVILIARGATATAVLGIGILVVPIWMQYRGEAGLLPIVELGIIGGLGLLMYNTVIAIFSAELAFTRVSLHLFTYGYVVLGGLAVLTYFKEVTSTTALMLYGGIYFLYCTINIPYVWRRLREAREIRRADISKVFTYSKWLTVSTVAWAIKNQMDVLIVASLLPLEQVGLYAAAARIVLPLTILVQSIGGVLAPRISSSARNGDYRKWCYASLKVSLAIVGASLGFLLLSPYVVPILGENYSKSLVVFRVLLFAAPFSILTNLLSWVLLANDRPAAPSIAGVATAALSIVGILVLVPAMGIVGAAVTRVVVSFIGAVTLLVLVWRARGMAAGPTGRSAQGVSG